MQYPNIRFPNIGSSCSQHGANTAWLMPQWPCNVIPVPKTFILLGAHYLYLLWIIGQYTWNCEKTVGAACSVLPHLSVCLFTYSLNVIKLNIPRPVEDNASIRPAVSRIWKARNFNDSYAERLFWCSLWGGNGINTLSWKTTKIAKLALLL